MQDVIGLTEMEVECLKLIRNNTAEMQSLTNGVAYEGGELELVTVDNLYRVINEKAFLEALKEEFPEVTVYKKEGPGGGLALGPKWRAGRDNADRVFLPFRPMATICDNDQPAGVQRWEILFDHKNTSPERAVELTAKIQPFAIKWLEDRYPGLKATFHPKFVPDLTDVTDIKAIVKYLEFRKFLPENCGITTAQGLKEAGFDLALENPGNSAQSTFSIWQGEKNLFWKEGTDELSDMAHWFMAGFQEVLHESAAIFASCHEAYIRHGRDKHTVVHKKNGTAELAQCKPLTTAYPVPGATKYDSFPILDRPYDNEANDRAINGPGGMASDPARKSDYGAEVRNNDTCRVETRFEDCYSNPFLRAALRSAAYLYGYKKYAGRTAEEVREMRAGIERGFEPTLQGEYDRMKDSQLFRELLGDKLFGMARTHVEENIAKPVEPTFDITAYFGKFTQIATWAGSLKNRSGANQDKWGIKFG